eukprot:9338110-Pyramimonas_sp.AAC.1
MVARTCSATSLCALKGALAVQLSYDSAAVQTAMSARGERTSSLRLVEAFERSQQSTAIAGCSEGPEMARGEVPQRLSRGS